jgi:hypothetical protein
LGHVISEKGHSTNPAKIQAIVSWPTPSNVHELHGFLGLAGYYHKFVRNFGMTARPLTNLLKKDAAFVWMPDHDSAFATLQQALSSALVLALLDFCLPFHIETDASATGVGAVLQWNGHPLAYMSKALGPRIRVSPHMKRSIWP